jgi:hypothetical protein
VASVARPGHPVGYVDVKIPGRGNHTNTLIEFAIAV